MSCGGIPNSCGSINPWNYQATKTTKSVAWSATVLGILAVSAGVLVILASSGVHLGAFNCMSRLTFGGGITLATLGGASSLLGTSWLISRFKSGEIVRKSDHVPNQEEPAVILNQEDADHVPNQEEPESDLSAEALEKLGQNIFPNKKDEVGVPGNIAVQIFSYVSEKDVRENCTLVCKNWNEVIMKGFWQVSIRYASIAFGKAQWETYCGDVGEAPPLPGDIWQILKSPCPFWPEKKVEQTHLLTLIPASVNKEPLTLESLNELLQNPQNGGHSCEMNVFQLPDEVKKLSMNRSYWALIPKLALPHTSFKTYQEQKKLVDNHAMAGYVIPKFREITICLSMHYVDTQERLYGDFYTHCEEFAYNNPKWPVIVGKFITHYGVNVGRPFIIPGENRNDKYLMVAVRRFF
ncbi:MAG: hypothetical protein K940chlam9_01545 [Chlamydiae bacterium]|nr:hypothetical protein [Chlamydiota bacterium]